MRLVNAVKFVERIAYYTSKVVEVEETYMENVTRVKNAYARALTESHHQRNIDMEKVNSERLKALREYAKYSVDVRDGLHAEVSEDCDDEPRGRKRSAVRNDEETYRSSCGKSHISSSSHSEGEEGGNVDELGSATSTCGEDERVTRRVCEQYGMWPRRTAQGALTHSVSEWFPATAGSGPWVGKNMKGIFSDHRRGGDNNCMVKYLERYSLVCGFIKSFRDDLSRLQYVEFCKKYFKHFAFIAIIDDRGAMVRTKRARGRT